MEKFGSLTFVAEAGANKHGKAMWKLICDCGNETIAVASAVRTGRTKSCGCGKHKGSRRTHGRRRSRLYTIWCNMKARCDNRNHPAYRNYGMRGISYDPAWADFSTFAAAVGEPRRRLVDTAAGRHRDPAPDPAVPRPLVGRRTAGRSDAAVGAGVSVCRSCRRHGGAIECQRLR